MKLLENKEKNLVSKKMQGKHIDDDLYFSGLGLTSLKGAPSSVDGSFLCYNNKLKSLEGAPHTVSGDFYCDHNELSSLEWAPNFIGGDFQSHHNPIYSLINIHKQIKEIKGKLYIPNVVNSNILGVILINSLEKIICDPKNNQLQPALDIVNKHLKVNSNTIKRDVLECQEELIEKGFKEYAKL